MRKVLYVALGITLGFAATLFAQAVIPANVIKSVQCATQFYQNITPWEEVVAGGNPNVLYIMKTTERLPTGIYQTGIAVCYDNSQYSWQFTYR